MLKITPKAYSLLKLIAEYRILLTSQIAVLTGTRLRAAQKRIAILDKSGYLDLTNHSFRHLHGRPEKACSINHKGVALLKKESMIEPLISPKRIIGEEIVHISHELMVNWFRIHLSLLEKHVPDLDAEFISSKTPFLPLRDNGLPMIADTVRINDKSEWFIPDGVFSIASKKQHKRLLFFLEIDMSTEPISRSKNRIASILQKVIKYQTYCLNKGYKRYQKKWQCELNGFRVLFLTNTPQRKETISRSLQSNPSFDFIWISDAEQLFLHGLGAKIWARGSRGSSSLESILGPTFACELSLPILH